MCYSNGGEPLFFLSGKKLWFLISLYENTRKRGMRFLSAEAGGLNFFVIACITVDNGS